MKSGFLKDSAKSAESIRTSLLGNSWHTETVGWLLNHYALYRGFVTRLYSVEELRAGLPRSRPPAVAAQLPGDKQYSPDERLVLQYLRGADHRGSDVRLETGCLFRPDCWPRCSLNVDHWVWKEVMSYPWKYQAHINELEARGALLALQWRLRRKKGIGKKYLHILDSVVSLSVLSKKRSSSYVLNRVIQ